MSLVRILTVASAIAVSFAVVSFSLADAPEPFASTMRKPRAGKKPAEQSHRRKLGVGGPGVSSRQLRCSSQKCLRALDGTCTDPIAVEMVRLRAEIIPTVRVSYFGTPAGTIGGAYIPFERLSG